MNSWIILCLCNDLQRFHFLLSAFVLKWGEVRAGSVQGKSHKAAISLLDLLSFVFTVAHTWLLRDLFFLFFLSKETWPPLFGDIYQMHCVQDFCSVSVCAAHAYVWIADWHWAPGWWLMPSLSAKHLEQMGSPPGTALTSSPGQSKLQHVWQSSC